MALVLRKNLALWVTYTGTVAGRDKFLKLVDYYLRFHLYFLPKTDAAFAPLKSVGDAIKSSRKLFRIGRSADFVKQIIDTYSADLPPLIKTLNIVRAFGYAAWLFYDNGAWLESILGLKQRLGWNPQAIGDRAARWWLLGLVAAIILDIIHLQRALQKSKEAKKETLDLVRDVCDTAAPLFRLGLIVPNEAVVGIAGVISSVISIYQTFPRK